MDRSIGKHSGVFTLCEGRYHLGAAALLNSLIRQGFSGDFILLFRDDPPSWLEWERQGEQWIHQLQGVKVIALKQDPPRHLGYQKPFAALELLDRFPGTETLAYADPDIVFLSPWSVFSHWADQGFGVVMDANFSIMPDSHPWRCQWRDWLADNGFHPHVANQFYANSGFFICRRNSRELLQKWASIIRQHEADGGDTSRFHQQSIGRVLMTGDQDALAMAMMCADERVSWFGPEGMGFTGHHFLLSHAVEKPKPWENNFISQALRGFPPSVAAGKWLEYAKGPVQAVPRRILKQRSIQLAMAKGISRIWRRG